MLKDAFLRNKYRICVGSLSVCFENIFIWISRFLLNESVQDKQLLKHFVYMLLKIMNV